MKFGKKNSMRIMMQNFDIVFFSSFRGYHLKIMNIDDVLSSFGGDFDERNGKSDLLYCNYGNIDLAIPKSGGEF